MEQAARKGKAGPGSSAVCVCVDGAGSKRKAGLGEVRGVVGKVSTVADGLDLYCLGDLFLGRGKSRLTAHFGLEKRIHQG